MSAAARKNGIPVIPAPGTAEGELAIFVAIGPIAVAIPAHFVTRLVLPQSVRSVVEATPGAPSLVEVEGVRHAAFDLGVLLGSHPTYEAWVLLAIEHRGRTLAVALRTGTCLVVERVPSLVRVPATVIARRGAAVVGAFAASQRHGAAVGVQIDPSALFTSAELDACQNLLARAP